jgi:MscS family membrane protein
MFLSQAANPLNAEADKLIKDYDLIVQTIQGDFTLIKEAALWIGVALVAGWLSKKFLAWIAPKFPASPIAQAAIHSAGKALQLLIPAYTLFFFFNNANLQDTLKSLVTTEQLTDIKKVVSIIVWTANFFTLYHFVAWPIAWAKKLAEHTENKLDDVLVPMLGTASRALVVVLGIIKAVAIIDPTMVNAFLALLGSGGIAIGLASQDTLKNTFGAIMLIIDQPFIIGDFINTGAHEGQVESLGLRSTTLVLLDGQRLTIPNSDLANRPIVNITRRDFIRVQDVIHLEMNTSSEDAKQALKIVRELMSNHEGYDPRHPPMAHIQEFSDWAVNLRIMYWYHPADGAKQLEYNQRLILQIIESLQQAGIRLAAQGLPQKT